MKKAAGLASEHLERLDAKACGKRDWYKLAYSKTMRMLGVNFFFSLRHISHCNKDI